MIRCNLNQLLHQMKIPINKKYSELDNRQIAFVLRMAVKHLEDVNNSPSEQTINNLHDFLRNYGHIIEVHANIEKSVYRPLIQFLKMWALVEKSDCKDNEEFYSFGKMLARLAQ